jgi:hypothetical protein
VAIQPPDLAYDPDFLTCLSAPRHNGNRYDWRLSVFGISRLEAEKLASVWIVLLVQCAYSALAIPCFLHFTTSELMPHTAPN